MRGWASGRLTSSLLASLSRQTSPACFAETTDAQDSIVRLQCCTEHVPDARLYDIQCLADCIDAVW